MGIGYYFGDVLNYIPGKFQIAMVIVLPFVFFFALRALSRKLATVDW
jgi:hypothetical protein